jgi:hypothetical protein
VHSESIQTPWHFPHFVTLQPYTLLSWSTFGSDYSIKSSWVGHYKLGTPVFGEFLPFFSADPQALSGWMGSIATQLFSGLYRYLCQVTPRCEAWHSGQRVPSLFNQTMGSSGAFEQTPSGLSCALFWGVASVWPLP